MQFSVIGQWLIDGKSPHTGQPVIETCRIVVQPRLHERCDGDWFYDGAVWSARVWKGYDDTRDYVPCRDGGIATRAHAKYRIGQSYAIQPGRGQKSIGRTPPIESIYRQDVREMTQDDAVARGFAHIIDYLITWCAMHDRPAWNYAECDLGCNMKFDSEYHAIWRAAFTGARWLKYLNARQVDRYDAWVLRFADPAASGDSAQERGE